MATTTITLSNLKIPTVTLPKTAVQRPRASIRVIHDETIPSTRHQNGTESTTNSANDIDDQTSRLPFGRLMLVYACLATAYFTSTFDINAVATALPVIGSSLNAGSSITWAGTAYLMGTVACPLYGRLSDIFGRKPVLTISLLFIVLGGILCGFAQTPTWLYVCRALSGIGGGGVSSVVQIVVSDLVSMRDRGKYQGLLSAAIGLGSCTGPFVAAEMLRRGGEAWRWIFWMPPIMASGCLISMWFLLPLKPVTGTWWDKLRKIDWYGLVVIVAAMVFLLVSASTRCLKWYCLIAINDDNSYPSILAGQCGLGTAPWLYRCSASARSTGCYSSSSKSVWQASPSFLFGSLRKDRH
jgi:MFS family permease